MKIYDPLQPSDLPALSLIISEATGSKAPLLLTTLDHLAGWTFNSPMAASRTHDLGLAMFGPATEPSERVLLARFVHEYAAEKGAFNNLQVMADFIFMAVSFAFWSIDKVMTWGDVDSLMRHGDPAPIKVWVAYVIIRDISPDTESDSERDLLRAAHEIMTNRLDYEGNQVNI